MATIQITLKSRKKRDGTYPVVIRIRHNKQYLDIQTSASVPSYKFDKKRGRIIGNNPLSHHLEELKELYSKKLRTFIGQNANREFDFEELKSMCQKKFLGFKSWNLNERTPMRTEISLLQVCRDLRS